MGLRRSRQRLAATAVLDANPRQRLLLYLFGYLAALTALLILHLALDNLNLTLGLVGALTAGYVYSYFLAPVYRAITTYSISLLAAGISVSYFLKITANLAQYGNFLGVLLGILTALLAYKAFSPADHRFILMVCVIFLLFSGVASYDLKFMVLLPLFLIFAGVALHVANQIDVAVRVAGTAKEPAEVRFHVGLQFLAVLLRAILGLIGLSIVAYVIAPHSAQGPQNRVLTKAPEVSNPLNEQADLTGMGGSRENPDEVQIGIGNEFDLTDQRRLTADPRPVLQLKSHRAGYLRAQVYDVYTGSGWVKSPRLDERKGGSQILRDLSDISESGQFHGDFYKLYLVPLVDFPSEDYAEELGRKHGVTMDPENDFSGDEVSDLSYDILRQEIKLLEPQPPFYYAMYQPFRLENVSETDGRAQLDTPLVDAASVVRPLSLEVMHPVNFAYTVYSLEVRPKPAALRQVVSGGPAGIVRDYTQLPLEERYDPQLHRDQQGIAREEYRPISRQLVNFAGQFSQHPAGVDQTGQLVPTYDKVQAIVSHLLDEDEGYLYDREFTLLDSDAELTEAFVLGTRQGYCRYFASAMAVLCRLNGIPARVVTGYAPGSFSLIENAYIYRASNAHAWVEVYFDGYGWIMFDPTPTSRSPYGGSDAAQWLGGIVDFLQDLFIIDPARTQQMIVGVLGDLWRLIVAHWPLAAVGALALLAIGALVWAMLRLRWRKRSRRLTAENPVVAAYDGVARELARLGFPRRPGQTARSYLGGAGEEHAVLAEPLARLAPAYERAAFSVGGPTDVDLRVAAAALAAVEDAVSAELQRRRRSR